MAMNHPLSEPEQARESVEGVPRLLSLAKICRILDAFSASQPELPLGELAKRADLPTSTCMRIVRNLMHEGLLERVGDRYRIGLTTVRWAAAALEGRSVVSASTAGLNRLRDETGESVLLCVRDGAFRVVVAVARTKHVITRQVQVGEVEPLHAGSTGRIFLAFDSDARRALEHIALEKFTDHTPILPEALDALAEESRRLGYAVSRGERHVGSAGISAPIFDHDDRMIACIALVGPAQRITNEMLATYPDLVMRVARSISYEMGSRLHGVPLPEELDERELTAMRDQKE